MLPALDHSLNCWQARSSITEAQVASRYSCGTAELWRPSSRWAVGRAENVPATRMPAFTHVKAASIPKAEVLGTRPGPGLSSDSQGRSSSRPAVVISWPVVNPARYLFHTTKIPLSSLPQVGWVPSGQPPTQTAALPILRFSHLIQSLHGRSQRPTKISPRVCSLIIGAATPSFAPFQPYRALPILTCPETQLLMDGAVE